MLSIERGINKGFDKEYHKALVSSYHKIIDIREDLRI